MRIFLLFVGWISLALGIAGVFLPLLPTTPFILLSAACFARSSERFHHWLVTHPNLGPILARWRETGAIPRKAKLTAVTMVMFSLASTWILAPLMPVKVGVSLLLACVVIFVVTRPD